jgi:predicted nucleotidyltransferase
MSEAHLQEIRKALSTLPSVRLAVLFGSAARGRATTWRDLDVGVLLEEDRGGSLWEVETALAEATRWPVDLVDLHRAPPLLRFQIARDGRLLLERRTGDWRRFKVQAILDWWDWAPTARALHRRAAERLRGRLRHGPA